MQEVLGGVAALLFAILVGWFFRGRNEKAKREKQKAMAKGRKEVIKEHVETQDDQTLVDRLTRRP